MDIKLFYFLNDLVGKSGIFDAIVIFLASHLQYILGIAFLFLLYLSAYPRRHKFYIFWVTIVSVVIARLGITEIIRFFYHRPRPFMVFPIQHLLTDNEWSFPSGHSTFFFAMATAIYLYNKRWGMWFFIVAILINVSRVIAGVHYPSDILGGAIIGVIIGYLVYHYRDILMKRLMLL